MDDPRRYVTIRVANVENVRGDDGTQGWVRQPGEEWQASCKALQDTVGDFVLLRHTGPGLDWNAPSESMEQTWVLIAGCNGQDEVDEVRELVEAWLVANGRHAAWFFVTEPDVARGALLQARPR